MPEYIVLIDENNGTLGYEEKLKVHEEGLLHRAFSVFIYSRDRNAFLIQRRAKGKYHSGGLLSNSCCSHPRKYEDLRPAISRCIKDELGIEVSTFDEKECLCGKFTYFADFGNLSEHETDFVYLVEVGEEAIKIIKPNPAEIEKIFWWGADEIEKRYAESPESFSAWFKRAYDIAVTKLNKIDPTV